MMMVLTKFVYQIYLYAHKDDDSGYRGDIHVHELGTLCFVVECDGFSQ